MLARIARQQRWRLLSTTTTTNYAAPVAASTIKRFTKPAEITQDKLMGEPVDTLAELEESPSNTSAGIDWTSSFHGIAQHKFTQSQIDTLMAPINEADIEVKPDGLLYLPEIKYRRILNKAFGPGGWGIVPRSRHTIISTSTLTREYALIVGGRFLAQARGEQDFFGADKVPTATEGVKSNALMRCCKDLGVASELWDPVFIRKWKQANAVEVWAVDVRSKQKKRLWKRRDEKLPYPYQEQ